MQELENVLKEIESVGNIQFSSYTKPLIAVEDVIKIIRAHIPLENDAEIARSSRDNDGWISVEERLPEEKINPASQDFCEYQVTAKFGNVKDVRHYKYGNGHWRHGPGIVDEYVIAWRPLPEPYRPERSTE